MCIGHAALGAIGEEDERYLRAGVATERTQSPRPDQLVVLMGCQHRYPVEAGEIGGFRGIDLA